MKIKTNIFHNYVVAMIAYITIIYVPGIIAFYFFQKDFIATYIVANNPTIPFFISFFLFILFFIAFIFIFENLKIKTRNLNFRIAQVSIVVLLIIFLFLSIYFYINYSDSSFRHNSRLSESSPFIAIMFVMLPIFKYLTAKVILHSASGLSLNGFTKAFLIIFLASSLLSLNSSLGFIVVPILLIILLNKEILINKLNLKKVLSIFIIAPFIAAIVVFIGIGNKVGYSFIFDESFFSFMKDYMGTLIVRPTTSLFTLVYIFEYYIFDINFSVEGISAALTTFENRISLIMGFGFNSELIATIDRINYLELYQAYNERAGATPNILASMFFMPFGVLFVPLLAYVIIRQLFSDYSSAKKYNLLVLVFLTQMILPLFEGPLNIFMIIDQNFITLVFIIVYEFLFDSRKVFGISK